MAEEGKKIVFTGVDNASRTSDAIKRSVVGLHTENIKGLKDTNSLLKEQNTLLEAQKRLITSIASEGLSRPQQQAVGQLTNKLFQSPDRVNPEHLKSYSKILEGQMHIGSSGSMSEKLIQKVQELIDTQKLQHRETFTHHQKDDEQKKEHNKGALTFLGHEVAKHKKLEHIEKLNSNNSKKFEEVSEKVGRGDSDNKMITVLMDAMHGNAIGAGGALVESAEEKMGKNLPWIAAAIASAGYGYHKLKEIQGAEAGAQTGESLSHAYIEMNPLELELSKNLPGQKRHRSELSAFQSSLFSSAATTGSRGGFMSDKMDEALANLGLSSAEGESFRSGSSRSRGNRASDSAIYGSIFANKVLGIDQGNIGSIENASRYGGEKDVKNVVEQVISNLGGQTKANENLQELVNLGKSHLNVLGRIDQQGDIALIKAFSSGSGALFQNAETRSGIMSKFDQGLSSPGNDFQKAERFATLSKLNPGKSFPQLMREMQKGSKSNGVVKETLTKIARRGGGIDGMVMELVAGGLVSGYEEAYELAEDFMNSNQTMFDNISGAGIKGSDTSKQASYIVDRNDKGSSARIKSAFAKSVTGGMTTATNEASIFNASEEGGGHKELDKQKKTVAELFSATDNVAAEMHKTAVETKIANTEIHNFAKATNESTKAFRALLKEINNSNGIKHK